MPFEELVKQYQKRIVNAIDKKYEIQRIIQEINRLTYASSGQLISDKDKKKILVALKQEVICESVLVHSQDNKEFLESIDQAIKKLGEK